MEKIAFINSLEKEFNNHSNQIVAKSQKAYMRNQFDFYGLTASLRREIQKPIRDAYLDANPDNSQLRKWLDDSLQTFDSIYSGERPGFLEGYKALKDAIVPWGS